MAELELSLLNEQAKHTPHATVARAETAYTAAMHFVADRILARGDRILMLAGPSGSGKTTSANLLRDCFARAGHAAHVVSLDDFYRRPDDPDYPCLPDGRPDYECVEALQVGKIHDTIEAIQRGEDIMIPKYDFKRGISIPDARLISAKDGSIVILEGLHALNPILTQGLTPEGVFRLFISVSTNINDGGERILSGRKIRFVRRLVRDSIFRSTDAARTLALWQNVLHGEDLYLYPYKETADFKLNTFHAFELGVLGPRALSLLDATDAGGEYARIVKAALRRIVPIPIEHVPTTSLIREFVAGGVYEELY